MGKGALILFYGKHVLSILKTCSTRLELRNLFTNVHEPIETRPYFLLTLLSVRAVYYGNPFDFYPFNTNDHRYPYKLFL